MDLQSENQGNTSRMLLWIVLLGLAIRLGVALLFAPPLFSDDIDYVAIGKLLARGGGFLLDGSSTTYRPPGYPYILSLFFRLFGDSLTPVRLAQAACDMVSCLLVFSIGRKLFDDRVGLVAAGIFALSPMQILYVSIMMTETLFTVTFLGVVRICMENRISTRRALLGGIVLGAGTLIRPTLLLLPCALFAGRWGRRESVRSDLRAFLLMGAVCLVVLLPWLIRNEEQFGRLTLTSNTGVNFWIGNHPGASGAYSWPDDNPLAHVDDEFARSDLGMKLGLEYVRDHPLLVLETLPKKWAHFFAVDYWLLMSMQYQPDFRKVANAGIVFGRFSWFNILLTHLPFAAVLLLCALGAITRPPGEGGSVLYLLSPVAYWLLVHMVFYAGARYRFPIDSLLMVGAAHGTLLVLRRKCLWTRARRLAFAALTVLFLSGWIAERVMINVRGATSISPHT
ncbi:MAG TPA: glycosyltransferase family 39 protein [Bacteroidota bacterium]|nr:glycosyltransferase family 39 protein [Bacteroidota bacterium]